MSLVEKMKVYHKEPFRSIAEQEHRNLTYRQRLEPPDDEEKHDLICAWNRGGFLINSLTWNHPAQRWVMQDYFTYLNIVNMSSEYDEPWDCLVKPTLKLERHVLSWKQMFRTRGEQRRRETVFILDEVAQWTTDIDPSTPAPRPRTAASPPRQKDQKPWSSRKPRQRTI